MVVLGLGTNACSTHYKIMMLNVTIVIQALGY